MDDEQFHAYCEKKLAMKQQANERISQTGAVRRDWRCSDCGSVLSWDSTEARQRHYKSRKHTQKAKGHIPK
jgi:hypothetical protein